MKCFYHSADLDGHCSGAIVKNKYNDCQMFGINYGDEFPWDKIIPGESVYMVDFSLQPFEDMIRLDMMCNLFWIDHHISAILESEKYQNMKFKGVQKDGIGACALVWEFLYKEVQMPKAIRLLAEYDVWNHSNPETLPFQYAMRLEDTWPEDRTIKFWDDLFYYNSVFDKILSRGDTVLKYVNSDNEKYCKSCSFDTEVDGLKCIAVNKMLTNSQVFDSVWDNSKYDAMLTFGRRKGKWTVSLYTDKTGIDVSIVAKNHGGGGHVQAAGFQCEELPFKI